MFLPLIANLPKNIPPTFRFSWGERFVGLSPYDYSQMCINDMAHPASREKVEAVFAKWLAEDNYCKGTSEKRCVSPEQGTTVLNLSAFS